MALPGAEDFFDRQPLAVDRCPMAPGCDARDSPLKAELPEKPFPAVEQEPGEGSPDMSESDECEIDLSRFLFHSERFLILEQAIK
jgi:hypothetical protein